MPAPGIDVDADVAARLLDDRIDLAEAEAGALAGALGGEEGIEHLVDEMGGDAGAGVADLDPDAVVGAGGGGNPDRAAVGHRIAGVDDEVEDRQFELVGVGGRPQRAIADLDGEGHLLADRADQQVLHVGQQPREVDGFEVQPLGAREDEQLLRQPGRPGGRLLREADQPRDLGVLGPPLDEVEVADDHRQQVVEVVRDAAGQLADRVHLLRLGERRLGAFALGDLLGQTVVRCRQRIGAFGDARLEHRVQVGDGDFGGLHRLDLPARLILALAPAQRRGDGAGQRIGMDRPFEHDDIAEPVEQRLRLGRPPAGALGRQHDERKVRPRRLPLQRVEQQRQLGPDERFLGDDRGRRPLGEAVRDILGRRATVVLMSGSCEQALQDVRIAAVGRKDQNAILHPFSPPERATTAAGSRRGNWAGRSAPLRSPSAARRC